MTAKIAVCICHHDRDPLEPDGSIYDIDAFGGVVPSRGDLIIDPGAPAGKLRSTPENRTILKVLYRYLRPAGANGGAAFVFLVVEGQPASLAEINILGE